MGATRSFQYVGSNEIRALVAKGKPGIEIVSRESLLAWLRDAREHVSSEGGWATYVVNLAGVLLVAPRRSEHVVCASGNAVLAAGEIRFGSDGDVVEVTNVSSGYCPAEDCWTSVAAALRAAVLPHPPGFTFVARFRRCPKCGERNLVKDDWFSCALCDADLPKEWNFG